MFALTQEHLDEIVFFEEFYRISDTNGVLSGYFGTYLACLK